MLGGADNTKKRVRLTLEIDENKKDEVIRFLQEWPEVACEVVSVRRIQSSQSGNARKRFAVHVPCDDEPLRPSPVRLFPQRNEAVATCESNDSGVAAPPQAPETTCAFCPRAPCITTSDFKPNGRCDARMTNYSKRRKDYEWYWRTLKDNGLWDNPMYLEKKQQLGCLIDDVREVTPHCVIKDVRDRWPNPSNVPYQRHRRS